MFCKFSFKGKIITTHKKARIAYHKNTMKSEHWWILPKFGVLLCLERSALCLGQKRGEREREVSSVRDVFKTHTIALIINSPWLKQKDYKRIKIRNCCFMAGGGLNALQKYPYVPQKTIIQRASRARIPCLGNSAQSDRRLCVVSKQSLHWLWASISSPVKWGKHPDLTGYGGWKGNDYKLLSIVSIFYKRHDVCRTGRALCQGPCPHPQLRTLKMKPWHTQPGALQCHLSYLLSNPLCVSPVTGRAIVSGRWVKVKLPQVQLGGAC